MTPNTYATLIYYWHGDPHPESIEEILCFLEHGQWEKTAARDLAVAGTLLAFDTLYPDRSPIWRAAHVGLYTRVERDVRNFIMRPEYADFLIAQWFMLHDLTLIDMLLSRMSDGGESGSYAASALQVASTNCIPFRHALNKVHEARGEAMIIRQDVQ